MYIAEVTPAHVRGRFVSLNQLTIVIGILAAQVVNWLVARPVPRGAAAAEILASWNGQTGWRWMFWACAVPAVLFFLFMLLVPESPRWLVKRGREATGAGGPRPGRRRGLRRRRNRGASGDAGPRDRRRASDSGTSSGRA